MTVATRREGPPIVEVLRDSIRQRLLPPGAPLIQAAIAEALGVSRIPVREALQFLASEGLVAFTDEGTRVTALEPAEVHELWSLRALIEAALADGIVGNANEPDRRLLGGLVDGMDSGRGRRFVVRSQLRLPPGALPHRGHAAPCGVGSARAHC